MTTTWDNPEQVLRSMLADRHGALEDYSSETPNNLASRLPFHRISAVRGADDTVTDTTIVDIESFASSRWLASQESEALRGVIRSLVGKGKGDWLIDSVSTVMRPVWRDYRNPMIQRFVATYSVDMRPRTI